MQMAHRTNRNFGGALPGNTDQKRHPDDLLSQAHRCVIASSVFEKLLAVIRGQSKHAIIPQTHLPETIHESGNLTVYRANTRVIQLHYLVPFSTKSRSRQIRTI